MQTFPAIVTRQQANQVKLYALDEHRLEWHEIPLLNELALNVSGDLSKSMSLEFTTLAFHSESYRRLERCAFSIGHDAELEIKIIFGDQISYHGKFVVLKGENTRPIQATVAARFTLSSSSAIWQEVKEPQKVYLKPFRRRTSLHRIKVGHFEQVLGYGGLSMFRFRPSGGSSKGITELLEIPLGEPRLFNVRIGGESKRVKIARLGKDEFQGIVYKGKTRGVK